MRALVKESAGPGMTLRDVPRPACGPTDVLICVRHAGVCGTDLHIWEWDPWAAGRLRPPVVVGHEFAGEVVELGGEARAAGLLEVGDPVTAEGHIVCGHCLQCRTGSAHLCQRTQVIGVDRDGAFAEYIAMPVSNVMRLDGIPTEIGAIMDPLGNAVHTVLAGPIAARTVAITGCGPIGLMIARVAQLSGARLVCATEPLAHRRLAAPRFGASTALDPAACDVVREIKGQTDGYGVDVAFEAAGSESATVQAIQALRPGGTLVLLGYWKQDQVAIPGITAMRKGLTVRFVRRMKNTFDRAIDLARRGLVDVASLVTHEFSLEQTAEAFVRAERRGPDILKAVIRM